jgi:hypothetical protein
MALWQCPRLDSQRTEGGFGIAEREPYVRHNAVEVSHSLSFLGSQETRSDCRLRARSVERGAASCGYREAPAMKVETM